MKSILHPTDAARAAWRTYTLALLAVHKGDMKVTLQEIAAQADVLFFLEESRFGVEP